MNYATYGHGPNLADTYWLELVILNSTLERTIYS